MGFWDRIRGKAASQPTYGELQGNYDALLERLNGFLARTQIGVQGPVKGTLQMELLYAKQPWMRSLFGMIATDVARLNWRLYRPKAGVKGLRGLSGREFRRAVQLSDVTEVSDQHAALDIIQRPCPAMKGIGARKVYQLSLDIVGDGFFLKDRGKSGALANLWPCPADWVQRIPTFWDPKFWIVRNSYTEEIEPENMLWSRDPDPSNPYGRGAGLGMAMQDEFAADEYAAKLMANRFKNDAVPQGLVSFKDPISPANIVPKSAVKAFAKKWNRDHNTVTGKGEQLAFTNGAVDVKLLDRNFRELQLADLRVYTRDAILQTIGIPPEKVGVVENSNRATAQVSKEIYVEGVIIPRAEFQRDEFQAEVIDDFDDRLILAYDDPMPRDRDLEMQLIQWAPYAFMVDEIRGIVGAAELDDGGDLHPVPGAVKFVEKLEEKDEPVLAPPGTPGAPGQNDDQPATAAALRRIR